MGNSTDGDKKNIVKLAHLYSQSGQWDKALVEYRKILVMDPDDMNTHIILGDIYLKKNDLQMAYEAFSKAVNGLLSRGQMDKSILVYKRMAKLDATKLSEEAKNKINLSQNYIGLDEALKSDHMEEAIKYLGKLLKNRVEDPVAQAKLQELDFKIAQLPVSATQYQTLGDLFLKNDIYDKAQEMFKKIAAMNPNDVAVRSNLAQVYLKQGSENDAKKEYLNIADEALTRGDLDQAFEFAHKAIGLKSLEAHYVLGIIYFKRKKWVEAKNEFEKLLRIKTSHLGALIYLGKSLDLLNQKEKAAEVFNKALQVDKNDPYVQEAWIEFCVKHNEKEVAIPFLTVLLDKAVTDNNLEEAVRFSKIIAQMDPELVLPQIRLVQLLQKLGDLNGAADACCALALIYDKRKNYSQAIVYLEKALELSPANAEVLEKALLEMRQKAAPPVPPPAAPILTLVEPSALAVESTPSEGISEMEPPQRPEPSELHGMERTSQDIFLAQMATADQCIKQGLLKAAIEIYQQLLKTDSVDSELKKKVNLVSDDQLKNRVESKRMEAKNMEHPFFGTQESPQKKITALSYL